LWGGCSAWDASKAFVGCVQFGHCTDDPCPLVDLLGVVELSEGGARWSFSVVSVIRASRKKCGNVPIAEVLKSPQW